MRVSAMGRMSATQIRARPFTTHLRHNPTFHDAMSARERIVPSVAGRELDLGGGKGWQLSVYPQIGKHDTLGTRGGFVAVKQKADRPARLHKDRVGVVPPLYEDLHLLDAAVGRLSGSWMRPRTEKEPKLPNDEHRPNEDDDYFSDTHTVW